MELEITIIKKEDCCSQFAVSNGIALFQFEPRNHDGGKQWYFWPTTNFRPKIFNTDEFPLDYFKELCKALNFLYVDDSKVADTVKIIEGENLLKWRKPF